MKIGTLLDRARHAFLQLRGYQTFGRRVEVHGPFSVGNPKNVTLGDHCAINHNVFILGHSRVELGNGVILSAGVMLIDGGIAADGYAGPGRHYEQSFIRIEDGAWIGAGAVILPGVTVGRMAIVGAGSVVTKDVAPYTVVVGNPAKLLRHLQT